MQFQSTTPSYYYQCNVVTTCSSDLGAASLLPLYASIASCFSLSLGFSRTTHFPSPLSYARAVTTAERRGGAACGGGGVVADGVNANGATVHATIKAMTEQDAPVESDEEKWNVAGEP